MIYTMVLFQAKLAKVSVTSIKRTWKKRFVGYEFTHNLKIEFDADNELLGKLIYSLSKSQIRPEYLLVYG